MKVGILTFHRANNCGAVLQCYALQEAIKSLGHEVCIIDYRQPYIEEFSSLKFKIANIKRFLKNPMRPILLRCNFKKFRENYLNISSISPNGDFEECDVYVIGSDQVWSENCTIEFDNVYFGYFKREPHAKIVGYSISCPLQSIDKLGVDRLKNALKNFSSISFREPYLRDYIFNKIGFVGNSTLDPTLLFPSDFWRKFTDKPKNGKVLLYLYKYRLNETELSQINNQIRHISRQLGIIAYDMSDRIASPRQFLQEIMSAKYIITNSFHAVAFSLIFRKNFGVITSGDGLDTRYEDLLKTVGAQTTLMTPTSLKYENNLDYDLIEKNLQNLQNHSLQYLKDSISYLGK